MPDSQPSKSEIDNADGLYQPFPAFGDWPHDLPDQALWDADVQGLQAAGEAADEDVLDRARGLAMRTAAFETGAIEGLYSTDRGLTLTVAEATTTWAQEVSEREGADAVKLFESQLDAFRLVLDFATKSFPKATQKWIRDLHAVLTEPQETYVVHTPNGTKKSPLPRGEYKTQPNHVITREGAIHAYAPVEQTHPEMSRLVEELGSSGFEAAHPVIQAAYSHYAFVAVHPFADGNGRVARALASAYTYRAASVPLLLMADQREAYFDALADADDGDPRPFIALISQVSRDAVRMVTGSLRTAQAPQPEDVLAAFTRLHIGQGDLTHAQLDAIAVDALHRFEEILLEQTRSLDVEGELNVEIAPGGNKNQTKIPDGFRSIVEPGGRHIDLHLVSPAPATAEEKTRLRFFVSSGEDPSRTVAIDIASGEQLILGLHDLQPKITMTAEHNMREFARRTIGFALDRLLKKAKQQIRQTGYPTD